MSISLREVGKLLPRVSTVEEKRRVCKECIKRQSATGTCGYCDVALCQCHAALCLRGLGSLLDLESSKINFFFFPSGVFEDFFKHKFLLRIF